MKNMLNPKRYGILILLIISMLYYYWHFVYVHMPTEAMARANITNGKILHSEGLDNGRLFFYRHQANQDEIVFAYEEKNPWSGWQHVNAGGAAVNDKNDDLSWCWSTIKEKEVAGGSDSQCIWGVVFGEINNPAISSVKVKANIDTLNMKIKEPLIEKRAEIIKAGATRLWYVIADRNMGTAMKVYAYDANGKLIYIGNDWGNETADLILLKKP